MIVLYVTGLEWNDYSASLHLGLYPEIVHFTPIHRLVQDHQFQDEQIERHLGITSVDRLQLFLATGLVYSNSSICGICVSGKEGKRPWDDLRAAQDQGSSYISNKNNLSER
ncbi:hypothetical protein SQ11_14505 [Nitrosospira sp. NpAV]|nr:hypothetical protein SQ11_14505 [Nitrosospira sp. NpAV]